MAQTQLEDTKIAGLFMITKDENPILIETPCREENFFVTDLAIYINSLVVPIPWYSYIKLCNSNQLEEIRLDLKKS